MRRRSVLLIVMFLGVFAAMTCGGLRSRKPIADALAYAEAQGVSPQWIESRTDAELYAALVTAHPQWTAEDRQLIRLARVPLRRVLLQAARERARRAKADAIMERAQELYPGIRWRRVDDWVLISLDGADPNRLDVVGLGL